MDLSKQLVACGVSEAAAAKYLDTAPSLAFSVYYGGRSDCGAEAQACSGEIIPRMAKVSRAVH